MKNDTQVDSFFIPGPYIVRDSLLVGRAILYGDDRTIAILFPHPNQLEKNEEEATMRLIAKAPDLYALAEDAKGIVYNLYNGLEKRSESELMAIFDAVLLKIK